MKKILFTISLLLGFTLISYAQERENGSEEDLKVEGQLYLPNMNVSENVESGILVRAEQGQAKLLSFPNLLTGVYGSDCFIYNFGGGITSITPSWQSMSVSGSSTGYLFTGSQCPAHVGIGTDTPRSRLDVIGTTYTTKLALGVDPQNMIGRFHMKYPTSSNIEGTVLRVENADRQLMNLDNFGLLRVREVKLDTDVWPDYVFDDNYVLMSLEQVEEYIDSNKHLPGVPSENDIKEDGQNLGEMDVILLEKIEELTLYIIEQQKLLENQQKQIQILQEQIQYSKQ